MAVIDIVMLVVLAGFVVLGAIRGIVRDVVTVIGLVLGIYLAWRYGAEVNGWLAPALNGTRLPLLVGQALILVVVVVASVLLAALLARLLNKTPLGWLDRLLGAAAGLVKGAALVWVLVTVAVAFRPDAMNTVRTGPMTSAIFDGGNRVLGVHPGRKAVPVRKAAPRHGEWVWRRGRSPSLAGPCDTA